MDYEKHIADLIDSARIKLSNIKPSDWAEKNRSMTLVESTRQGKFSYQWTPYTREIVDCLSPDHPARIIAVMKGSGIGLTAGVIEPGIGWIIAESPSGIFHLTGHANLSEKAVQRIDLMIDSCGIRHLIRPTVQRARNMKTGDTNTTKEFAGGNYSAGSASNHKLLRQVHVQYGFVDDFDASKQSSKESGSTRKMIEQRFTAYYDKMKLCYSSTPELKQTSNIEPVYLLGDQRKYFIPCPCCGEQIVWEWSIPIEGNEKETGGITWKLDSNSKLISESVGYICQKCGKFFDDSKKVELNLAGEGKPTADPSEKGYHSYHLSSLYAPPGMYDWEHYVRQYLEANAPGQEQKEHLQKTFINLCLGLPFEPTGESVKANELQKNIRNYSVNIIPEKMSEDDGNGKIVMLTCACDLNGKEEDGRLDYETVAWSESGSSYSITHGSVGTFIPNESGKKNKVVREKWTYHHNKSNSIWPVFKEIIDAIYLTDTGRQMRVFITGIDTGWQELFAFTFIDKYDGIIGLKGDKEHKLVQYGVEVPNFKKAISKSNLYMLRVGQIKDDLAALIRLKWDSGNDDQQPSGFMNFPLPGDDGKYLYTNYFSHYEAETRIIDKDNNFIWKKKTTAATLQNHFWDVRVYNIAVKEILAAAVCQEHKIKSFTWRDYCNIVLGNL